MKIKYWSATYSAGVSGARPFLTSTGNPCFTLAEAKQEARAMHSSNAVVVRADAEEKPTTEVIWSINP